MKIIQVLLLIVFFFLSIGVIDSNAQQFREMQPLEAHDFECLQSLQCVENSESLKNKGWAFVFDDTVDEFSKELTAKMKGSGLSFFAKYDELGNLIRSKYKRKNVALPPCLLKHLVEGSYKGWQITSSEMVIRDFDTTSIRYKVLLKNKRATKSEIYDVEFINGLHLGYEGLAKH